MAHQRTPARLPLDEERYPIIAVEDEWDSSDAKFFKVRTLGGKQYILRHDEHEDEWTLECAFDGAELFARPSVQMITVGEVHVREAERQIAGCEHCRPEQSEIPVD